MKKKISFILTVVLILMMSYVLADMGAPMSKAYKAAVSNPEGTDIIEYTFENGKSVMIMDGRLKMGDTVQVIEERKEDNGKTYANVIIRNGNSTIYRYILKDDLTKISWELSDYQFQDEIEDLTIIAKEGVDIYEWPSKEEYKVIGKIPYMATLRGRAPVGGEADGWYYVTYNGVNGWICELNGAIGTRDTTKTFMTLWKETPIRETVDYDSKILGYIPVNTVVDDYYKTDAWSWSIYAIYNGISGYIFKDTIAYNYQDEFHYTRKNYTVNYDSAVLIGLDHSITPVPKLTQLKCSYMQSEHNSPSAWGLTNYDGKQGWVYCNGIYMDGDGWMTEDELSKYIGDVVEVVKGLKNDSGDEVSVNPIQSGEVSGETLLSGEVSEDAASNTSFTMTPMNIILICILCAVIASATTAVVIVLINKNKKG